MLEREGPRRWQPARARENESSLTATIAEGPRRVYLALPLELIGTAAHRRARSAVRTRFPGAEVLDPAVLFGSSAEWRERWPGVLRDIDALVFVPGPEGAVGAGVLQEVLDARLRGLPVEHLGPDGRFSPVDRVRLRFLGDADPSRVAVVVRGGR